jgi:uncharacterized protein
MENPLGPFAVRVLGALIEKEITTPANYPLSLNALTAACNQSSNRDPVMALDEAAVAQALDELAGRSFVRAVHRSDSRVRRWRQTFSETLHLHAAETAVLCVLMLRGAQTAGEIRTRSARLHEFPDLARLDLTLQALMTLTTPLVVELPRRTGQKEARFAHLLSGEPPAEPEASGEADGVAGAGRRDRLGELEQTVAMLRDEIAELRARFDDFRGQFE